MSVYSHVHVPTDSALPSFYITHPELDTSSDPSSTGILECVVCALDDSVGNLNSLSSGDTGPVLRYKIFREFRISVPCFERLEGFKSVKVFPRGFVGSRTSTGGTVVKEREPSEGFSRLSFM